MQKIIDLSFLDLPLTAYRLPASPTIEDGDT